MSDELGTQPLAEPAAPSQAPAAAPTPAAFAPAVATPQPSLAPAQGAPSPEDRHDWIPPHRWREREAAVKQAQADWAQREAAYQARMDQIQNQLHALVGVQPPQNPEVDAVRQQFGQLYPTLAKLEERGEDLMGLISEAENLKAGNQFLWDRHGAQTMDRVVEKTQAATGRPVSREMREQLHSLFLGYVQRDPERVDRYVKDPTLVDDFVKYVMSNLIDPFRMQASAAVANRAATVTNLPQDAPSGALPTSTPQQKMDLDDRAAAGWAVYQQNKRP